jgi:hypothetical protein
VRSGFPRSSPAGSGCRDTCTGGSICGGSHDTTLSSHVRFAYQALAIDEEREPFKPTLWDEGSGAEGQTLEQVWFAGVHTEVGGGASDASLSDIALLWMAQKAREQGLVFLPDSLAPGAPSGSGEVVAPNYTGPIVDSRKGIYRLLPPYHRLTHDKVRQAPGQAVASSARRRLTEKQGDYSPPGLDAYVATKPTVLVEEGQGPARV